MNGPEGSCDRVWENDVGVLLLVFGRTGTGPDCRTEDMII